MNKLEAADKLAENAKNLIAFLEDNTVLSDFDFQGYLAACGDAVRSYENAPTIAKP